MVYSTSSQTQDMAKGGFVLFRLSQKEKIKSAQRLSFIDSLAAFRDGTVFSQLFSLVLCLIFTTVKTILKMNMTHMFL